MLYYAIVYVQSFIKENQKVNPTFRHPAAKRNIIIAWLHAPHVHTLAQLHSYTHPISANACVTHACSPISVIRNEHYFEAFRISALAFWCFRMNVAFFLYEGARVSLSICIMYAYAVHIIQTV